MCLHRPRKWLLKKLQSRNILKFSRKKDKERNKRQLPSQKNSKQENRLQLPSQKICQMNRRQRKCRKRRCRQIPPQKILQQKVRMPYQIRKHRKPQYSQMW